MEEFERLKREIVDIIANEKVAGIGFYQRVAEKILKKVVYPHIENVKSGYEEQLFRGRVKKRDH